MSIAIAVPGGPRGPAFGTDAGGDFGRGLSEAISKAINLWESPDTPQNAPTVYTAGLGELMGAVEECEDVGASISQPSVLFAKRLLALLPMQIPAPMVVINRAGEAVFEWAPRRRRRLTIGISASGELRYAYTMNAEQVARVDSFSGTELPGKLAETIVEFFD
jgi:hypothetical protein